MRNGGSANYSSLSINAHYSIKEVAANVESLRLTAHDRLQQVYDTMIKKTWKTTDSSQETCNSEHVAYLKMSKHEVELRNHFRYGTQGHV
jgi:hypothetical protein